jgi:hypothetical protein
MPLPDLILVRGRANQCRQVGVYLPWTLLSVWTEFDLSAAFISCGLLLFAGEHDENDSLHQTSAKNVNTP